MKTARIPIPAAPLVPALSAVLLVLLLTTSAIAGERVRGQSAAASATDRLRLARTIYHHDFENIRDPDTGRLLPQSAATNPDRWPDFWEPVRAVGFPEYLIGSIQVVPDDSGLIPGAYRDIPNSVLRMNFDGTRVGIRTQTPVPVNPDLAYEFTLMLRDVGLEGARIRAGVDWMRIESAATTVLRSDSVPGLASGQVDWPSIPYRMLVGDVPPEANAARLFVIVDRDPDAVGGAYHGVLWLDDIDLRPLPKIRIDPPRAGPDDRFRIVPVSYAGLFDNIPDPNNPGYFKGRRYSRRVEITDVLGQPVNRDSAQATALAADEDGFAVEELSFPRDRYGVYYFNIRLFDANDRLSTNVMRAVAVMAPEEKRDGIALHGSPPLFGVSSGIVGDNILSVPGLLRRILERAGMKLTKIVPWRDSYHQAGENNDYYNALIGEIRHLRSAGITVAGVIRPPDAMFGSTAIDNAVANQAEKLDTILAEAGRQLGLYFDGWQWGEDKDDSFMRVPAGAGFNLVNETMRQFAGGMPIIGGVRLTDAAAPAFPEPVATVQAFMPDGLEPTRMWPLSARLFPWLFEPFYRERGFTYPPHELAVLARPPARDRLEENARAQKKTLSWLSIELPPAYTLEPNAASERMQLEDLMVKAIYAAIMKPDAIFLGDLFDPARGLLRRDSMGSNTLETMARPTYLAAGTLARTIEGADYLGRIYLLPPYEAHVFKKPGVAEAIIAIWHHDTKDEVLLSRKEIGEGPRMDMVDWAGNSMPLPQNIPVRRIPAFITGMPANIMLTRMSLRIDPRLPVKAVTRRQPQTIEIVNHITAETPVRLRVTYAARMPGGAMENNWVVQPDDMRLNLSPFSPQLEPGRLRYNVSPDPNSQIQRSSPSGTDSSGLKIAQGTFSINTSPATEITAYLPFNLRSDLDVEIQPLSRVNDPYHVTLQLKLRWFPPEAERRRGEIRVLPYFMRRGMMKESAAFPIAVKALPPEARNSPGASFQSYEVRIPKRPKMQTWVGLDEVNGSNFYLVDVTDYIMAD